MLLNFIHTFFSFSRKIVSEKFYSTYLCLLDSTDCLFQVYSIYDTRDCKPITLKNAFSEIVFLRIPATATGSSYRLPFKLENV